MTAALTAFLTARLDDDERIALAASSEYNRPAIQAEHWRWECTEDDTPLDVDLAIASGQEFLEHEGHWGAGLRSTEAYPSTYVGPLEHLVLGAEEITPQVARHIAVYDPDRVIREVTVWRGILAEADRIAQSAKMYPSQGNAAALIAMQAVLKIKAAADSDHPDYRQEWKPA